MVKTLILLYLFTTHAYGQALLTPDLIEKLPHTKDFGFGCAAMFSGTQFLPRQESGQWSIGVLGSVCPNRTCAFLTFTVHGARERCSQDLFEKAVNSLHQLLVDLHSAFTTKIS
jgi:hypothetical protein